MRIGCPAPTCRRKAARCVALATALAGAGIFPLPSATLALRQAQAPRLGTWVNLGTADYGSRAALLHVAGGHDLVAWRVSPGGKQTYDIAELARKGGIAVGAKDLLDGKDWSGVSADSALLMDAGSPLIVFSGQGTGHYSLGCVVGALRSGSAWMLQSWSLSGACTFSNGGFSGGAAVSNANTLSADFAGGVLYYQIGVAPTIPAPSQSEIKISSLRHAEDASEVYDGNGTGHFYGGWYQFFSPKPSNDGIYVVDLQKGAARVQKAPGSRTGTVQPLVPQPLAMASPAGRTGVYAAYCPVTSPCNKVVLWRYGSKKTVAVPKSANATAAVALTAGPSGRLWLAWYNKVTFRVSTVRTNKAGTVFGPVESFSGPPGCGGDSLATVAASSGPSQRLDVVVVCKDFSDLKVSAEATQSLTGLGLTSSTSSISHKTGGSVTYRVTDAGDPVQGARVRMDRRTGTTNNNGQVSFSFPKGAGTGQFRVTATMANYHGATGSLRVT